MIKKVIYSKPGQVIKVKIPTIYSEYLSSDDAWVGISLGFIIGLVIGVMLTCLFIR